MRINKMTSLIKHENKQQDITYLRQLCSIAAKSKAYSGVDEPTMLNIMLTANDLGISPMKALNGGFYIVNGKISMSTALMTDRIRCAGHSVKVVDWTKEKCIIIGVRKDNQDSVKVEYTMEDAQLAGLTGSPTWKKHPKAMLYNRAMSMLARVLFPDVVGNAYSEDERYDIKNVPPSKRPDEDPFAISIEPIEMETHSINSLAVERTFDDLCEAVNSLGEPMFSLAEVSDYVKYIVIRTANSPKKMSESEVISQALCDAESLQRFKDKLLERIEKNKAA